VECGADRGVSSYFVVFLPAVVFLLALDVLPTALSSSLWWVASYLVGLHKTS
jgi:hypothetical protein